MALAELPHFQRAKAVLLLRQNSSIFSLNRGNAVLRPTNTGRKSNGCRTQPARIPTSELVKQFAKAVSRANVSVFDAVDGHGTYKFRWAGARNAA
jgi:hypothetical protein